MTATTTTKVIFQGSCWAWPFHVLPKVVLGSWTFTTDGRTPADNPLLASISRLLQHVGKHSSSILLIPKQQGAFQEEGWMNIEKIYWQMNSLYSLKKIENNKDYWIILPETISFYAVSYFYLWHEHIAGCLLVVSKSIFHHRELELLLVVVKLVVFHVLIYI